MKDISQYHSFQCWIGKGRTIAMEIRPYMYIFRQIWHVL